MRTDSLTLTLDGTNGNARILAACALAVALAIPCASRADVFSDAKSWHQGFVDANGDGIFNVGKTEFPESLLLAEPNNDVHTVSFKDSTSEIIGVHTSVVLRTENVIRPYTGASSSETVAYFPQDFLLEGSVTNYYTAGLFLDYGKEPFVGSLENEFTCFLRFRWDGTHTINGTAAYFLGAGDVDGLTYGFYLGIRKGHYYLYSYRPTLDKEWGEIAVKPNEWTDLAITVNSRQVKIYSCQSGSGVIETLSATATGASPSSMVAAKRVVVGHGRSGATGWSYNGSGLRWQAFRGSIQSFASWSRALSAEEVRQVFAWPGTDLVRLGTANNSVGEFASGTAPTTINFNVAAKDAGLPQVLRVSATSTSAAGTFNVSVNGAAAGSLSVTPGKTTTFYVKKNLTVAGANTLTLTSADPVTIDAIALGGSLQLGNADGSWGEFAPETYGGKVFADVKSFHRGAIPYHGDNWAFNVASANPEFAESLYGNTASLSHKVAFNSPAEGANRSFTTKDGHSGIIVRTESIVYPYARRTERTKALYFPQDTVDQGNGTYKYWTAGLHLNTNNVPFIPKYDQANESCTFFLRLRWDGTVPIPGKPSYILGVGDTTGGTYGFSLGVLESGRYNIYSGKPNLSKTWNGEGDAVIAPNKWTDFAITLSNRKITIYSYQEGSSEIAVMSAAATGSSPASYTACNSFVIGHGRSGLGGSEWSGSQSRAYGFRGSIHSFAAWDRALSADEVRQVFAWPGERTIANLGVINDSNAEFGSTSTASWCGFTVDRVSGAVDWINMRGTFDSTRNRLGLSNMAFTADDITTDLTLRFATTAASDTCSFNVYVNDALAGSLSNVPGGTVTLALAKRFFIVGSNKVELRFMSASGTVYTDAIQLVRAQSGDYYATDLDQSDCAFGRYEIENGAEARQPTSIHFDVPDALAGKDSCRICVTIRFKCDSNQTLSLQANGETVATFNAQPSDDFQIFKVKIPGEVFHAGDNVLTLSNAAAQAGGSTWLGVDYFRVETTERPGMRLIVR